MRVEGAAVVFRGAELVTGEVVSGDEKDGVWLGSGGVDWRVWGGRRRTGLVVSASSVVYFVLSDQKMRDALLRVLGFALRSWGRHPRRARSCH